MQDSYGKVINAVLKKWIWRNPLMIQEELDYKSHKQMQWNQSVTRLESSILMGTFFQLYFQLRQSSFY